jgi:NADH:ubiquinone reductase (H+-translocating)
VIVGAGFAGLAAASELAGKAVQTTVVDRNNYNTFQPLLYQVATAGLNPGDIAYPVRSYTRHHKGVRFRQGTVTSVDFGAKSLQFAEGPSLGYDYLVIATGATTNYFGVPGASENSFAMYTLSDALSVRNRMFSQLERASAFGLSSGALTIVVVGGGPTGVEIAGALAELRGATFSTSYPELDAQMARVVLVEQQDRLLAGFDKRLSEYARRTLVRRGVEVRLGATVKEITQTEVVLDPNDVIPSALVVWAAGVAASQLAGRVALPQTRGGRLEVSADLRAPGHSEVFVVGDVAAAALDEQTLLPQLAQPAIQTGRHAAAQILRLIEGRDAEPFHYKDKGIMATIGRRAAVAQLPAGIRLRGTLAWGAWLGLHIVTLIGFRNRASVLLNWSWRYLAWRGGPRVIVGG